MSLDPHRAYPGSTSERCDCCRARPLQPRPATMRFWLPHPGSFAQIALDLDHARGWFALLCFRRNDQGRLQTANALPNRYRLRELETTLLDLNIALPSCLRRYLIAALGGDHDEQRALRPRIRNLLCCGGTSRPDCDTRTRDVPTPATRGLQIARTTCLS